MNILTTKERMDCIITLLNKHDVYCCGIYNPDNNYEERMDGLYIDGDVTFELMEKILEIAKGDGRIG